MSSDSVPYTLEEGTQENAAVVAAWPWYLDGDDWLKSGPCPRCGHQLTKRLVTTMFLARPGTGETAWGASGVRTPVRRPPLLKGTISVFCNCGAHHADGKSGCGLFVTGIPGPGGTADAAQ